MKNTYSSLFVELAKYSVATILVVAAITVSTAIASSNDQNDSDENAIKPIMAQLAIKSPKTTICPASATITGWIMTNKPGAVTYKLTSKEGVISGPFAIKAVKSVQGGMATFSQTLPINEPIDSEYQLVAESNGKNIFSKWSPINAACKIKISANQN